MSAAFADAWGAWMVAMAWQAALLIGVVWALDRLLLRHAWPALRHGLWILVGLKLVLPPSLTSPVSVTADATRAVAPSLADPHLALAPVSGDAPSLFAWPCALWLAGVAVFTVRGLLRARSRRRLRAGAWDAPAHVQHRARAAAARLRLRRTPDVRVHPAIASPVVFGVRRPVVLLPLECGTRSDASLDHVLLHELGHVRRGDLWMQAAFAVLSVVYWFHPFVGVARRRAHAAREVCCDLTVAGALGGEAGAYRRTLLAFAARLVRPVPVGALGFSPRQSMILTRLAALERHDGHPTGASRLVATLALLAVAVVLLPMAFDGPPVADRLATVEAELDAARDHLDDTLMGDGRYGCFDKRIAYFEVLRLEEERSALVPNDPGGSR